jgi:photosystem II stability/assembly factor-like uncharacterized protein
MGKYATPLSTTRLAISTLFGGLLFALMLVLLASNSYASSPAILAVSPAEAPNNFDATIVISGAGFQVVMSGTSVLTAPAVRLGNTALALVGLPTAEALTATVPWGLDAGVYSISVQNPDGDTATASGAFTVTAAMNVWTTGGPYGGSVSGLAIDEDVTSTLYANLDATGFFKSEDSGESWSNLFPGYITCFALKPGDPQTIYLGANLGGDKLLRSADGGQNWAAIWESRPAALGVSPADPNYLYLGAQAPLTPVIRSVDGGTSWEPAGDGLPADAWVAALAVHPITSDIAYAGLASGGVYTTADGGAHWQATGDAFGETEWSVLAIDSHDPQRIYGSGWHGAEFFARSLDGGATWEAMTLGSGEEHFANDLKFDAAISGTIYALTSNHIYRSLDAGATWDLYGDAPGGWSLALNPQTSLPFYIGHNGKGIYRSDDGGIEWQVHNQGLAGVQPTDVAPSAADPRYVYMASDDAGGFVSNNGGTSWRAADGGPRMTDAVAADPYVPTTAYMGAVGEVYKTTDGGQTWDSRPLPGLEGQGDVRVRSIAIAPDNPQIVYAGAGMFDLTGAAEDGWLFRSSDAGETWQALTVTFAISPVSDIVIDPTDPLTMYVSTGRRWVDSTDKGSGIIKTTDGGDTWAFVNQGLTAANISRLAVNPDNPQVLYAGANLANFEEDGGIFKTVDGGAHWQQSMQWLRISGLEVDPLAANTVYAGSYWAGLWRSTDAGATWARVEDPLGHLSSLCLNATQAPSRTLIYAGVIGGLVNVGAAGAQDKARAAAGEGQFFGSGVYQLTVARRLQSVFLPAIMKK